VQQRQFFLIPYLRHLIRSRSRFDIHSPFIYEIYRDILTDKRKYPQYQIIESTRRKLLKDHSTIIKTDFGQLTGVKNGSGSKVSIRKITMDSSVSPVNGQLLFRLAAYFKPRTILELGTSVGISTLYLAFGSPGAEIISIEGCPETLGVARKNFEQSGLKNIRTVQGAFDMVLPGVLRDNPSFDFVFIDGNHRKEAVLSYFQKIQKHISGSSILILHDIHWSEGMEQAWKEIRSDPSVTVTIDLFQLGLVFFKESLSREEFIIHW
jgi:predicted O-methyltransferase YrrM